MYIRQHSSLSTKCSEKVLIPSHFEKVTANVGRPNEALHCTHARTYAPGKTQKDSSWQPHDNDDDHHQGQRPSARARARAGSQSMAGIFARQTSPERAET